MRRIPMRPVGFDSLLGQRGQVTEALDPREGGGMVRLDLGSFWLATSETPLPVGAWVEVAGVKGTRLQVRPLEDAQTLKES